MLRDIDISHARLLDLVKIAELAHPFYQWIEKQFQQKAANARALDANLRELSESAIAEAIDRCFNASEPNTPKLYDGAAREYPHRKACLYFFAWLLRDAPLQRLLPLVTRAARAHSLNPKDAQVEALSKLFVAYRDILGPFTWEVVREVFIDRLEGSRRSLVGHEKEAIVRAALTASVQRYFATNGHYGIYEAVSVSDREVRIGNESFDASLLLKGKGSTPDGQVLMPIKTRETSGGGHAHLFTRDINSAIAEAKQAGSYFVVCLIVAQQWSDRELRHVEDISDLTLTLQVSPTEFDMFPDALQQKLDEFIRDVLGGRVQPKTWPQVRALMRQPRA